MALSLFEPVPRLEDIARVIGAEFDEMPGMRLTYPQARRLWNLSDHECTCALDRLCKSGHIARDPAGSYVRRRSEY